MRTGPYALVASLVLALGSNDIRSATLTWNGSVSTDWNNPTNWNLNRFPLPPPCQDQLRQRHHSGRRHILKHGLEWRDNLWLIDCGEQRSFECGRDERSGFGRPLTKAGTVNWTNGKLYLDDDYAMTIRTPVRL